MHPCHPHNKRLVSGSMVNNNNLNQLSALPPPQQTKNKSMITVEFEKT